jgi:hypothetical protein
MTEFNLGPITFRAYSGDNWSHLELAFATNARGGMARRETAVRLGLKSEHLIQMRGKDNPNDSFVTPEGNVVFGKIDVNPAGVFVLSAKDVYALGLYQQSVKNGLLVAEASAAEPAIEPAAEPQAETTTSATPAKASGRGKASAKR